MNNNLEEIIPERRAGDSTGAGCSGGRRPLLVRVLLWVPAFCGVVLVAVAGLFAALQTQTGRERLVQWVEETALARAGLVLEIGPVHGVFPLDFDVETLVLGDQEGPWLRVKGFSFGWAVGDLLDGRLRVPLLSAQEMDLVRLPAGTGEEERGPAKAPGWPPSLPPVLIDHLGVDRLRIREEVLGEEALLRVRAHMALAGEGGLIRGECLAGRLEGPGERLRARWGFRPHPAVLDLEMDFKAPAGGLLSRALGVDPGSVMIRLEGDGPPGGWEGRLDVSSSSLGSLDSNVLVRLSREEFGLAAEGTLEPAPGLVPAPVPAGALSFTLDGSYGGSGTVSLTQLDLASGGARASVKGEMDLDSMEIQAGLELAVPELSGADLGLPQGSTGPIGLLAEISGHATRPACEVRISIREPKAPGFRAETLSAFLEGRLPIRTLPALQGLEVKANGEVDSPIFSVGGTEIREPGIRWSVNASLPDKTSVSIESLHISDGNADLGFSGLLRPSDLFLEGRARARVRDLSSLPVKPFSGFHGGLELKARLEGNGLTRDLSVDMEADLRRPGPFPPALSALAGDLVRAESLVEVSGGERIVVQRFAVRGAAAEAAGEGELDLAKGDASGVLRVDVPELEKLSPFLGMGVRGKARVEAKARDLLGAPRGHGSVKVESDKGIFRGETGFTLKQGSLALDRITLIGPGASVSGGVEVNLETACLDGSLKAEMSELAALPIPGDSGLSGCAVLETVFSEERGRQDIRLELLAEDVSGPFGSLARAEVKGSARDVTGTPKGRAEVDISLLDPAPGLMVERAGLIAEGGRDRVDFSLSARGDFKEPFNLDAAGLWNSGEGARELLIRELQASLGGHNLALEEPLLLEGRDGYLEVHRSSMGLDSGRITLRGKVSELIEAEVSLEALPLDFLRVWGLPDAGGLASGRLRVRGTPAAPEGLLALDIKGIKPADPQLRGLPELELSSTVNLEGGLMEARAQLTGGGQDLLEAVLEAPVEAGLRPFVFSLPPEGPIRGFASMDMDLRPVPGWLGLEEHRLAGMLEGEATLRGTPASPEIRGRIHLRDGAYEYIPGGTVLRGLEVLAAVEDDELVLERLSAGDGDQGSLEIHGRLGLDPEKDLPFEAVMEMSGLRLVRLDELTAVTGGSLKVTGSAGSAAVSGRVRVDSAEARIPERLPPRITELSVEEVNAPPGGRTAPGGKEAGAARDVSLDLGIVIPGRVFVRGRGLDSEWEGELEIKGDAAGPAVRGELSIVRGHYDFLGTRFDLASGTLFFDGSYPPSPVLNVTAQTRTADMTARVILSGTPASPGIRLESDPPYPRDEIMARILFGRSLATLTPLQALKLAAAVDALAGGGALGFMGKAQQAVGVDQLEVREAGAGENAATLAVGKYMGEDVYLEVEKGLGTEGGRVSLEYEVTPRITVETEVGSDAGGGVGIKWKWDY